MSEEGDEETVVVLDGEEEGLEEEDKEEKEENVIRLKRRRKDVVFEGRRVEENTSLATCAICFDDWSADGPHQVSSLACGHLFGKSCVEEWLRRGRRSCPSCQRSARVSQIRPLWLGSGAKEIGLARTTNQDMEDLVRQLKEAQMQLEKERENNAWRALQGRQIQVLEQRIRLMSSATSAYSAAEIGAREQPFADTVSVDATGSRVVDLHASGVALLSERDVESGGFNVSKTCFSHPSLLFERNGTNKAIHSGMIRNISSAPPHSLHRRTALTASQDGSAKVVSVDDLRPVITLELVTAASSCCWSEANDHVVFCGCERGQFFAYDIRQPSAHLEYFSHAALRGTPQLKFDFLSPILTKDNAPEVENKLVA